MMSAASSAVEGVAGVWMGVHYVGKQVKRHSGSLPALKMFPHSVLPVLSEAVWESANVTQLFSDRFSTKMILTETYWIFFILH